MATRMSKTQIMKALDISAGTWNKYVEDGVIEKGLKNYTFEDVATPILKYRVAMFKREQMAHNLTKQKVKRLEKKITELELTFEGSGSNENPKSKDSLDKRLVEKRIQKMEMDAAIRMKEYIPVELFTSLVANVATQVANGLDPIPSLIKRSMPDMRSSTYDKFCKELAQLRNAIAEFSVSETIEEYLEDYEPKGYFDKDTDD